MAFVKILLRNTVRNPLIPIFDKLCRNVSSSVNIIGAPVAAGQPKRGTDLGPEAIRSSQFIASLERQGWTVKDSGDLIFPTVSSTVSESNKNVKNAEQVSESCEKLAKSVEDSVKKFDRTIVLGGDHSLAIGSISGHAASCSDLCVIWIDAHTDINTPESSLSGNMHGMPLSFLIREMNQENESKKNKKMKTSLFSSSTLFRWIKGSVSASSFAFIGIRDMDEAERNFLQTLSPSISVFSAEDVKKIGGKEIMSIVLKKINPNLKKPIHVSFDIDALDPVFASSTGTPVAAGISLEDAIAMGKVIAETERLSVLDLVEVNPLIGQPDEVKVTCKSAHDVIVNFLGSRTK